MLVAQTGDTQLLGLNSTLILYVELPLRSMGDLSVGLLQHPAQSALLTIKENTPCESIKVPRRIPFLSFGCLAGVGGEFCAAYHKHKYGAYNSW